LGTFLETRPFHDVDVDLYVTEESRIGPEVLDGAMELEPTLAQSARRCFPVDVCILNDVPVSFCDQVLRGRLLLLP